eukprot:5113501-Ditylum_brightwellii.AAC.1
MIFEDHNQQPLEDLDGDDQGDDPAMLTGVYQHSPDDPDFPHPIQDSNTETQDDFNTNTNIPSTGNNDSPDEEPSLVNDDVDIHTDAGEPDQHDTEPGPSPEQHPEFETNPDNAKDPDIGSDDDDDDKMPNL